MHYRYIAVENIVRKGEIACNAIWHLILDNKIFRLVQTETKCRQHFKVHLK